MEIMIVVAHISFRNNHKELHGGKSCKIILPENISTGVSSGHTECIRSLCLCKIVFKSLKQAIQKHNSDSGILSFEAKKTLPLFSRGKMTAFII